MEPKSKYNLLALSDFDPTNFKDLKLPKNGIRYPSASNMAKFQIGDIFEIDNDEKVSWWIRAKKLNYMDETEDQAGLVPSSLFVPVNPGCSINLSGLTEVDKELILPDIGSREKRYFPLCAEFYHGFIELHENPIKKHSILSRIFYSWISTYIVLGFKRYLLEGDIWTPVPARKIKNLKYELNRGLKKQSGDTPPIFNTFLMQNKRKFILAALCKLIQDITKFLTPLLIRLFINYSENPNRVLMYGIGMCFILFIARTVDSLLLNKYFEYVNLLSTDFRCILSSMVNQKLFSIRPISLNRYTQSFQTNLISVDSYRVGEGFTAIIMLSSCFLQMTLCLMYLYAVMGVAFLSGVGVLILIIPINIIIMKITKQIQVRQMELKDCRIKLITQLLDGIKLVKLYSWEDTFRDMILKIRQMELKEMTKVNLLYIITNAVVYIMPFSITMAIFITFMKIRGQINATVAFESISIFGILRLPFMFLPELLQKLVVAKVSYKRFIEFLSQPDTQESSEYNIVENSKNEPFVKVSDGNFSFDDGIEPFLTNINFEASSNELHVIVGENGSGKTKLLHSLLNENVITSGRVEICGQVCYVPQNPWIRNLSLRDNILDGNPFDKPFYDSVIDMCQLAPDIELLPCGDHTEIGERGVNLSGGQKQRVGLARAVYSKSNIYLLDDPFSNLDKSVGQKIFQKIISPEGCLSNSVLILITRDDIFLRKADMIHLMKNGKIVNRGTYLDLIEKDLYFSDFISKIQQKQEKDSVDFEDSDLANDHKIGRETSTFSCKQNIITADTAMQGRVKRKIYYHYIKSHSLAVFMFFLLSIPIYYGITIYGNIVVAEYTSFNISYRNSSRFFFIYGLSCVGQLFSMTIMGLFQTTGIYLASKCIHHKLLTTLMRSPLTFFESTPIGRIINAFSLEISVIDSNLPKSLKLSLVLLFSVLFSVFSIAYFIPTMLIGIIILSIIYFVIQAFYIKCSRQLQRLESQSRVPILSHLFDTINGISILRSNQCEEKYTDKFDALIDLNSVPFKMNMYSSRWLGVRLELLGNVLILLSAFAIVFTCFVGRILPGAVGYILFTSTSITNSLSFFIIFLCDTENQIVSIERISAFYYAPLETEKMISIQPVPSWPDSGRIKFVNYSCKYRKNLPDIIHDINLSIEPREKIGITGRTGSGKSSIILSLFRMVEVSGGCIMIDGVDINDISLKRLRESFTIIPQDAFLFKGTIRQNIDPANQYNDSQIQKAVELSQLINFVTTLQEGLGYVIDETGSNIRYKLAFNSLICLTRAILKHTKILILDEATSNLDLKTDSIIQEVIAREFKDCTIITIAHRVETIMNYDKILVLENGRIAEFDSPSNLLSNQDSQFYSLVSRSQAAPI